MSCLLPLKTTALNLEIFPSKGFLRGEVQVRQKSSLRCPGTSRLFSYLGYSERDCREHGSAAISSSDFISFEYMCPEVGSLEDMPARLKKKKKIRVHLSSYWLYRAFDA